MDSDLKAVLEKRIGAEMDAHTRRAVEDFRRAVGTVDGFCDLLSGDVNWPAVVRALEEVGYRGFLTAEMIPPYQHHPEALIENTSRAMDAILGRS